MLAKDMKTAAVNGLKANFHAQLSKAIRREVLLWEARHPEVPLLPGADEKARNALRGDVTRYAERSSTGSTIQLPWPEAAPAGLRAAVDALLRSWSCFRSALPCPKPEFMQAGKLEIFQRWCFAASLCNGSAHGGDARARVLVGRPLICKLPSLF